MKILLLIIILFNALKVYSFQESYSIQVFSSQNVEESYNQAEKCREQDSCFVYPVKIKFDDGCSNKCETKTFYRVFLGIFKSRSAAKDRLKSLKEKNLYNDAFIQKVVK